MKMVYTLLLFTMRCYRSTLISSFRSLYSLTKDSVGFFFSSKKAEPRGISSLNSCLILFKILLLFDCYLFIALFLYCDEESQKLMYRKAVLLSQDGQPVAIHTYNKKVKRVNRVQQEENGVGYKQQRRRGHERRRSPSTSFY